MNELSLADIMFDVKITPNRPDFNSHYIIAKHLGLFFNYKFEEPKLRRLRSKYAQ
jgi:phenylalanyl-tRNA synthetase beta subunit